MAVEQSTRRRGAAPAENGPGPDPLAGRLGLSVPNEWWASAPLLKSYEAAGFAWVQLHAPPPSVLGVARLTTTHALAAAAALTTTSLRAVVHAPSSHRAGTREGDRAFEGVHSYAAEVGAAHVVYHALALPEGRASEPALVAEARSLERHARVAERLEVGIAIENLAPLFPGPESLSANPILLRGLVRRLGSPAITICLDLGHAHIAADLRNTSVELLCEPVLDQVGVFHVHDNLGARRRASGEKLVVDNLNKENFRIALEIGDDHDRREWAMTMIRVARAIERVGDNTVDIGEQVAFVVTGLFREFQDASHPEEPVPS